MTFVGIAALRIKRREARHHLDRLGKVKPAAELYATANAFVTAARSVLYIAQYQFGFADPARHGAESFVPTEAAERKRFDVWFKNCPEVKAVLQHELSVDRNDITHRTGQAGFIHIPKPGGGMAVSHGTAFEQAPWITRRGLGGLPLEDVNYFYYLDNREQRHEAVPYCENYLVLIDEVISTVEKRPWNQFGAI